MSLPLLANGQLTGPLHNGSRKPLKERPYSRPNRQLAMGPVWYEKSVREWEEREKGRARGR